MFYFRLTTVMITGILLYLQCSMISSGGPDQLSEGNGSGVGTGLVSGMLYEPDGITPAGGATVIVRNKNKTAPVATSGSGKTRSALFTALTDNKGIFSFDTIPDGLYVIEGSDDRGNMVLYDSVLIDHLAAPFALPDDTLMPAGTVSGTIELSEGGNYMQVFVLAFGVDRFCQVQSDGSFTFPRFAGGTYTLKILSLNPDYKTVDTAGVVVTSNDTTVLDTIRIQKRSIQPVPEATVHYDSLLMKATISWHPTPESITAGYNIYRTSVINGAADPSPERLNNRYLFKDTVFIDNRLKLLAAADRIGDTIHYSVTMVDTSGNESLPSTPAVVLINNGR